MPGSIPDLAPAGHPYRAHIEAERQGWYEFVRLVRSLTPEECLLPGYYRDPDWSVREVVAHLGTWMAESQLQFERMAADTVFDLSPGVVTELADVATPANEMVGWSYHHDRDRTGFIDGTENPPLMEAMRVALIPLGLAGDGGSILLLQQWSTPMVGWSPLAGPYADRLELQRDVD